MKATAITDQSEKYRYSLLREWDDSLPKITFILLNPSIADHLLIDDTLRKCLNYSIENGFGRLEIVNLFAYRAMDSNELKRASEPIGSENDTFILKAVSDAKLIIAGWGGENGTYKHRDKQVLDLLQDYKGKIYCFNGNTGKKPPQYSGRLKNGYVLQLFC